MYSCMMSLALRRLPLNNTNMFEIEEVFHPLGRFSVIKGNEKIVQAWTRHYALTQDNRRKQKKHFVFPSKLTKECFRYADTSMKTLVQQGCWLFRLAA